MGGVVVLCQTQTERDDGWQDVRQSQLRLMRCGVTRAPESCQMTQTASMWPDYSQNTELSGITYWVRICTTSLVTLTTFAQWITAVMMV